MKPDHKAALLRAQATRPLSMIIFEDSEDTRLDLNLAAAYLELRATLAAAQGFIFNYVDLEPNNEVMIAQYERILK